MKAKITKYAEQIYLLFSPCAVLFLNYSLLYKQYASSEGVKIFLNYLYAKLKNASHPNILETKSTLCDSLSLQVLLCYVYESINASAHFKVSESKSIWQLY